MFIAVAVRSVCPRETSGFPPASSVSGGNHRPCPCREGRMAAGSACPVAAALPGPLSLGMTA